MPIDPNIPLSVRGVGPIANPLDVMQGIQQMRSQREQTAAMAEQRRSMAEQTRLKTEEAKRAQAEELRLRGAYQTFAQAGKDVPLGTLVAIVGPERGQKIYDGHVALKEREAKSLADAQDRIARAIGAASALPEGDLRQKVYTGALDHAVQQGWLTPDKVLPYSPEAITFYTRQGMSPEKQYELANPKPNLHNAAPGAVVLDANNPKAGPVFTVPAKPPDVNVGSFEDYIVRKYGPNPTPDQIEAGRKAYQQSDDRPFRPIVPIVVQTAAGPQLLDRTTGTTRELTGPDGKPIGLAPTTEQRNQVAARGRLTPLLDSVVELTDRINVNQGVYAKLAGGAAKVAAKVNLDDDVAEYEAMVQAFTPLWARALGHTGVLTQQDVDSAKVALPRPGDSKSLKDRKLARINKIMGGGGAAPAAAPAGGAPGGISYQDYLNSKKKPGGGGD